MPDSSSAIDLHSQLQDALAVIQKSLGESPFRPRAAVILGSGLGEVADQIDALQTIAFRDLPHLPASTASGHRGQFIFGHLESVPIVAMAGRLHRYEGVTHHQATFPVHLMARLGVRQMILSNAAGGLNPRLKMGDIVVIRDHLNAIPGCFRPGMSPPVKDFPGGMLLRSSSLYDPALAALAMRAAKREGFRAVEGTYLATLGPTYESRSEYRMMRRMGADVAGMSTVPEVLVAHEYGIEVLALSLVSNVANPDRPVKTTHQDVLDAGRMAAVKMETILRAVLSRLRD